LAVNIDCRYTAKKASEKSNTAKVVKKRKSVSCKKSTRPADELHEDSTPYVVDLPRNVIPLKVQARSQV
jgi:hypothetical protein